MVAFLLYIGIHKFHSYSLGLFYQRFIPEVFVDD